MSEKSEYTRFIRSEALRLGFFDIGFSEAGLLDNEKTRLGEWLNNGFHSSMSYMENHFEKRLDPSVLVPGARSVVSLLYNYYTQKELAGYKISRYAYGKDYHKVIKKKLKTLFEMIKIKIPGVEGRYFVDSAPVLERSWARKSGLGWIGKSSMLINKKAGTFFFLSELVLNIELEYNNLQVTDHCGKCRKCIESCPTNAINENGYIIDAGKCISYLTIENKNPIPQHFKDKMNNYVFGCDICQLVCPWNKFAIEHEELAFVPGMELMSMNNNSWHDLTENKFNLLFEGSAVKRTKYAGLLRNIRFLNNKQNP
ncbi:MAG: tRNA epoxyqueuosine(34) reductase QueG [Deltaproteobacteria bacterium]